MAKFNSIIVTGGAGFVGSRLVRKLQHDRPDAAITVIDDFRSGNFENLSEEAVGAGSDPRDEGFVFHGHVIGRPCTAEVLFDAVQRHKPDVVFHEASITDTTVDDQSQMIRDNVEAFEALLDLAGTMGFRLVWASSAATYGTKANGATQAHRPFAVDDAGRPANVYGFSKWVMENLHRQAIAADPGLHSVGLRYFNVFGPGEAHKGKMASMVYQLAQQMLAGKPPRIFHDGTQARDQVYVEDVVGATIAAAGDDAKPGVYNVGSGTATSFNDIVQALRGPIGCDKATAYFENPYSFYQSYTCADLAETKAGLNWSPAWKPMDAIADYAGWLKRRADIDPGN